MEIFFKILFYILVSYINILYYIYNIIIFIIRFLKKLHYSIN